MKPPVVFSPIVNRARKFLKIGSKDENNHGKPTYNGISFSNDVYQGTCQPIETLDRGSRRSSISSWYKNSTANFNDFEEGLGPKSSVRVYDAIWTKTVPRKTSSCNDYVEVEELKRKPKMNEGIFTFELIKPPNGYLGLVLVGGTDTPLQKHYIKDILPNSTAAKDGNLRIGDEIIEINGHSLRGRTHSLALAVIHSLPPLINIVIERSKDGNKTLLSACLYQEDFMTSDACANANITPPVKMRTRKRSVLQNANESSIINKSVNTVINVQRPGSSASFKPAKLVRRESRCTSFIGDDESSDDDEGLTFDCEETKSVKEGGVPEEGSDCEDRLSMLSNTSAWCARQMMNSKPDNQQPISEQDDESMTDTTSVFSMSTLSDSLPPPYIEPEPPLDPTPLARYGSLRVSRRKVTESIIEVGSDEEGEADPPMFLRRGSMRIRGTLSLRGSGVEESEEERATWPTTVRRQRTSINQDTFVPPPNKPIRRSYSACVRRPSSMYLTNNAPTGTLERKGDETAANLRKLQRTNSGRFIDKMTLTTKAYRATNTGKWAFTIAGGSHSPYGDLPIHVLDVKDTLFCGSLKNGDEIVSFGGENFSNVTFLEAERKLRNFEGNCVTIIAKRKFLQRKKTQLCATYADAWNEQARTARKLQARPESLYC